MSKQMAEKTTKLNPEIQMAKDLYIWLWLSPVFTIPTLFFIFSNTYQGDPWTIAATIVLGSGLWHLVLLFPALGSKTEFVRWHGRQALLLAGARTTLALVAVLISLRSETDVPFIQPDPEPVLPGILLLVLVWLAGNLWGQSQTKRGDCSLMRWTGHGAGLPRPVGWKTSPSEPPKKPSTPEQIDQLVGIIRFNTDQDQRRAALAEAL